MTKNLSYFFVRCLASCVLVLGVAVQAADPIPVYRLVNGASADSDLKVLNLSATSNTLSGADGNSFTSFALNSGQVGTISNTDLVLGGSITGSTGAFVVMGAGDGTDTPVFDVSSTGFAGQTFVIPHKSDTHSYFLLNNTASNISVTVTLDGVDDTFNLVPGVTEYDAGSNNAISGIITAAANIYVAHRVSSNTNYQAYSVPPVATSLWGNSSRLVYVGAAEDSTAVTVYRSDNTTNTYTIDVGDRLGLDSGINDYQGTAAAMHIVADKPIAAIQTSDGDGAESTAFWSDALLATHSGVAVDVQYLAIACSEADTFIQLHDGATTATRTCSANGNYPGKAYFGSATNGANIAAGATIESNHPIQIIAENASTNDEINLFAYNPDVVIVNTTVATTISTDTTWHTGKIYEFSKNITVASGVTLTIEPGTIVRTSNAASYQAEIIVNGILLAEGVLEAPVVFTSNYSNHRINTQTFPYYDWAGIKVNEGAVATFNYALVEYAQYGVYFDNTGSAGSVSNSVFQLNRDGIFLYRNVDLEISYSVIEDNKGWGIYIDSTTTATENATPSIHHNTIVGNDIGIEVWGESNAIRDPSPIVKFNTFLYVDQLSNTKTNASYDYRVSPAFVAPTGNLPFLTLNAECNYWGSTDFSVIPSRIYDEGDNQNVEALVNYNHFALDQDISACSQNEYLMGQVVDQNVVIAAGTQAIQVTAFELKETAGGTASLTVEEGASIIVNNINSKFIVGAGSHMIMESGSSFVINSTATWQATAIDVYGTLDIFGDEFNPITLKTNQAIFSSATQYWDGIKVHAGGEAYLDYVILEQSNGLQYFDGSWGQVSNSTLRHNKYGVYLSGDADIFSNGNLYEKNTYGAYILGGTTGAEGHKPQPVFYFDVITENTVYGIYVNASGNINDPEPIVISSVLAFNGTGAANPRDYYLEGPWINPNTILDATGVYWGYDNYVDISAKSIFDHNDAATLPFVDYGQFFTDVTSSTPVQKMEPILVGAITTATILDANTSYTLISTLTIESGASLTVPAGTTLYLTQGFDINVASGATLNFEAGSNVVFEIGYGNVRSQITVNGVLNAIGMDVLPVTFQGNSSGLDVWDGIFVESGGIVNIDYINFKSALYGIYFRDGASGTINRSLLESNTNAVYVDGNSSPTVTNSILQKNSTGVYVRGYAQATGYPQPLITYNKITQNANGIYIAPLANAARDPKPLINHNKIFDNSSNNINIDQVYSSATEVIDARWNWWGSISPSEIMTKIIGDTQRWPAYATTNAMVDYSSYALAEDFSAYKTNTLQGYIAANTTLAANSSYTVIGNLLVPQGVTLTIEHGVKLEFPKLNTAVSDQLIEIAVRGSVIIEGDDPTTETETEFSTFTSAEAIVAKEDWKGFRISEGGIFSANSAIIEYATNGVYFEDGADSRSEVWNSTLQHNLYGLNFLGGLTLFPGDNDGIWIIGNMIDDCNYGVKIAITSSSNYKPPAVKFVYNWIKNSLTNGMLLFSAGGSDPSYNPKVIANANGFSNNGSYSVSVEADTWPEAGSLNFGNNYWGSFAPDIISSQIYDWQDVASGQKSRTPAVDFYGYVTDIIDETALFSSANEVLGSVDADMTLYANEHYTLIGDITIPEGVVVTVEEGVRIYSSSNYTLKVNGVLDINGTASNPVILSSDKLNGWIGSWQGLLVSSTGVIEAEYAIVQDAYAGITFDSVPTSMVLNATTYYNKVDHSTLQNNAIGLWLIDTPENMPITNNLIQFNGNGLYFEGAAGASVSGNIIRRNSEYGIYLKGDETVANSPTPVINNNYIDSNTIAQIGVYKYPSTGIVLDLDDNWWGTASPVVSAVSNQVRLLSGSPSSSVDIGTAKSSASYTAVMNKMALNQNYISPNNDGIQEALGIAADLTQSASWQIKIKDYNGALVKTYSGTGISVSVTWDGKDTNTDIVPDGIYRVELWSDTFLVSDAVIVDATNPTAILDNVNSQTWTAVETKKLNGSAIDKNIKNYTLSYEKIGVTCTAITCTTINSVPNKLVVEDLLGSWSLAAASLPPNGDYTVKLKVTDEAGNSTTATATVTLDLIALTNVTQNLKTVNLAANEELEISFNISTDADWVKMQIYPEQGGALVKEVTLNTLTAGSHTITWDGKDANGDYVAREAYEYILIAKGAGSVSEYKYDPVKTSSWSYEGPANSTDNFNAYSNDAWQSTMTVSGGSSSTCLHGCRILLEARPTNTLYAKTWILDHVPYMPGTYPITWDGVDKNGLRVQGNVSIWKPDPYAPDTFTGLAFSPNVVVIDPSGLAPKLKGGTLMAPTIEIKSDPYLIYHSYDQYLHIDYNLDRSSNITITLLPPGISDVTDPKAIQVFTDTGISGNKILEWTGHGSGDDINNLVVSSEGVYIYVIEATAVSGGAKTTQKGVVNIYR